MHKDFQGIEAWEYIEKRLKERGVSVDLGKEGFGALEFEPVMYFVHLYKDVSKKEDASYAVLIGPPFKSALEEKPAGDPLLDRLVSHWLRSLEDFIERNPDPDEWHKRQLEAMKAEAEAMAKEEDPC